MWLFYVLRWCRAARQTGLIPSAWGCQEISQNNLFPASTEEANQGFQIEVKVLSNTELKPSAILCHQTLSAFSWDHGECKQGAPPRQVFQSFLQFQLLCDVFPGDLLCQVPGAEWGAQGHWQGHGDNHSIVLSVQMRENKEEGLAWDHSQGTVRGNLP